MLLTDSSPINLFRWIDKIYHLQVCYMLALSLFFVWVMTGVRLTLVKCHLTLRQVLDCIRRLVVDPSQGKSSSICDSFNIQRIISPQHRKYFRSRFSSYHDFFYLSHFLFELWILTKDFFDAASLRVSFPYAKNLGYATKVEKVKQQTSQHDQRS